MKPLNLKLGGVYCIWNINRTRCGIWHDDWSFWNRCSRACAGHCRSLRIRWIVLYPIETGDLRCLYVVCIHAVWMHTRHHPVIACFINRSLYPPRGILWCALVAVCDPLTLVISEILYRAPKVSAEHRFVVP